jgi:hypothetical protein
MWPTLVELPGFPRGAWDVVNVADFIVGGKWFTPEPE